MRGSEDDEKGTGRPPLSFSSENTQAVNIEALEGLDMGPLEEGVQKNIVSRVQDYLLTRLTLNNCKMFSSSDFLEKFTIRNLTQLTLKGCEGVNTSLVSSLPTTCPSLEHLDLSHSPQLNMFGSRVAWVFAAYVDYPSLQELRLNHCPLLSEVTLRAGQLQTLSIQDDPALSYLSVAGGALKRILMDRSIGLADSTLDRVSSTCPNLESMSCEGCPQLKNREVRERLPWISQTTLNLTVQPLTPDPLTLNFSHAYMSRHVARELVRIPYLTDIEFRSMNIRDVAVGIILSHPHLTSAFLMSDSLVQIGDVASPLVLPSLEKLWVTECPKLTSLNVAGDKLKILSLSLNPKLGDLRVESDSLESFELNKSPGVSDKALDGLAESCPGLKSVQCTDCPHLKNPDLRTKAPQFSQDPFSVDILNSIENAIEPGQEVNLHLPERNLNEDMVVNIAEIPLLTLLNLTGNRHLVRLGVPSLPLPLSFNHLRSLYLNRCSLKEVRLTADQLVYLNLSDNSDLATFHIDCPLLEELHVDRTGITSDVLRGLTQACPKIKYTTNGCKNLERSLEFNQGKLDRPMVETLKRDGILVSLSLKRFIIESDALQELLSIPTLTHIRLLKTPVGHGDIEAFMQSQSLTSLHLMKCGIKDAGAGVIIKALKTNPNFNDIKLVDTTVCQAQLSLLDFLMEDRKK